MDNELSVGNGPQAYTRLAIDKCVAVQLDSIRDAVERYSFWHNGIEAVLTLSGPKGADNVDPWRIVSDSLKWH